MTYMTEEKILESIRRLQEILEDEKQAKVELDFAIEHHKRRIDTLKKRMIAPLQVLNDLFEKLKGVSSITSLSIHGFDNNPGHLLVSNTNDGIKLHRIESKTIGIPLITALHTLGIHEIVPVATLHFVYYKNKKEGKLIATISGSELVAELPFESFTVKSTQVGDVAVIIGVKGLRLSELGKLYFEKYQVSNVYNFVQDGNTFTMELSI